MQDAVFCSAQVAIVQLEGSDSVEAGSDSTFDRAGDSGLSLRRLRLIRSPVERMHRAALVHQLVYMRGDDNLHLVSSGRYQLLDKQANTRPVRSMYYIYARTHRPFSTVQIFNSCTSRPDDCKCLVVQTPMHNMSNKISKAQQ